LGLIALVAVTPVRADDDGSDGDSSSGDTSSGDSSGDGNADAPAPKPKKKAATPAPKPDKSAEIALDAISKLPVEPLSMDAAALKDDDRQFDMLPKALSGDENVEQLTAALTKATTLLQKMQRDVESEKVWTKNVYDIIQNYQYKYLKTIRDVKERDEKIGKLESLVKLIKQSTLHASVQREISKASKQLKELVNRSGGTSDAVGKYYHTLNERINNLKSQLRTVPKSNELYSETTNKMKSIMRNKVPPETKDALSELTKGNGGAAPTPTKAKKPKKAKKVKKY